jgi:hypothetical protein
MPRLIEHIDAIARREKRDALFIIFFEEYGGKTVACDWQENKSRKLIIEWLDANGYAWSPCGEKANVSVMRSYCGSIYIDTPFEKNDPAYRVLETFLENPDGTMRFPEMLFCVLPLESAMENAHHDEPGFWDRWAENF